jgi:hypothetical protein
MLTIDRVPLGSRVRIVHRIDKGSFSWTSDVEGELLEVVRQPTGSWYAHGKDDRYWLSRVRLRKPDGEVTLISLDQNSMFEVLSAPAAA